jgi:hypothetical protein
MIVTKNTRGGGCVEVEGLGSALARWVGVWGNGQGGEGTGTCTELCFDMPGWWSPLAWHDQTTEWMPCHAMLVGIRDNLQDLMANGPGCNELEA